MKSLNERMAELMGWIIPRKESTGARQDYRNDNGNIIIDKCDWHPDSDLNQAMEIATKHEIGVSIKTRNKLVLVGSFSGFSLQKYNGTTPDIARAICEGINEIVGGGDE